MVRPPPALARLAGLAARGGLAPAAALAVAGLGVASCSSPPPAALPAAQVMSVDTAGQTVTLTLTGSDTSSYGGFNFDGYSTGALTVRVPLGWRVVVECHNASSVFTHSCAVIDDVPIAPSGGPIAFSGASTANPVSGLPCGESASFSFVATRTGRYRIACLVSGHEADGMWDWLVVTSGGRPAVTT